MYILGMTYAIIPYGYPIKEKTQQCTRLVRVPHAPFIVLNTIATKPLRGIGEDNIRAGIVHDDRFFGYVRGVWSGPEKIEVLSRRVLNPESRKPIGTQFL